jgi:hypothetical protein
MSLSWITDILSGTGHVFGAQWWVELIAALRETRSAHSPGSSGGVDASALRKLTALLRTSAIAPHQPSGNAWR